MPMKVTDVERILVDVPFTERQQRITQRTVHNWSILELCRVTDCQLALYGFEEGMGTTVLDVGGFGAPLDLEIADPPSTTWIPGGGLSVGDKVRGRPCAFLAVVGIVRKALQHV